MTVEIKELRPGYSISRVIKGGWQLAGGHGSFDRSKAITDMARFVDAGIDTFDCADIYTGVESMIGEMITSYRSQHGATAARRIKVHTKLVPDFNKLETLTATDIEAIVDRSLQRLAVDRLDLVQFFWWDTRRGDPVGVLSSLRQLQQKGKIRRLGANNWDTNNLSPFIDTGLDVVSIQVQYSLLDARAEGRFSSWCAERNVHLFCYGTLAGGFLTEQWLGKPDPGYHFENRSLIKYRLIIDEFGGWNLFQDLLAVLKRIGDKHGVGLSAVASRFMLDKPNVAAVIIGARTAKHLLKTLEIFQLKLDADDHTAISSVLTQRIGPDGAIYELEGDKTGKHGKIMKYNLNTADA